MSENILGSCQLNNNDGIAQDCGSSIANVLELQQSCSKSRGEGDTPSVKVVGKLPGT